MATNQLLLQWFYPEAKNLLPTLEYGLPFWCEDLVWNEDFRVSDFESTDMICPCSHSEMKSMRFTSFTGHSKSSKHKSMC